MEPPPPCQPAADPPPAYEQSPRSRTGGSPRSTTFSPPRRSAGGSSPGKPARKLCVTMATNMETLDPSALRGGAATAAGSAVVYNPKTETVTLPGGLVSMVGITVVTGGAEMSSGSCLLAFGFWGTLIGISCVAVGLWDQRQNGNGQISHLLALGAAILALSTAVVVGVAMFRTLTRKRRKSRRLEREEGMEVLVEEGKRVVKKVTV